ncbi:MAG TPA: sulfotransferase, partial [Thermoanaerobaculia bacterium]|nr:sulfotransferase [Thermoanaerobaculia bacterium]
ELGEIESALARHPGVREAVVLASAEGSEDRRLVAYVVPERGERGELGAPREAPSLRELRAWAGDALPDYMLPGGLVICESLPLTPSGKVDRRALGRLQVTPGEAGAGAPKAATPPRTALERRLVALFAETLGVAALGVHDDFFELGGNSLRGAILINRLQEELGEIVHVVAIFDMPTVAALAGYLRAHHPQAVARLWGGEPPGETSEPERPEPARRVDAKRVALLRSLVRPLAPLPGPVPRNPRAVFVLSPPRSGTTLLRVMLGGHPRLFAPPELELLSFETLAERQAAFAGRDRFWLEGLVRAVMEARGWGVEEAAAALAAAAEEGVTTLELYGRLQGWLRGRILVDKTPSYALDPAVLARAEAGFEAPFYIHLLRHPHGMIRSFEEAKLDQIFFRREHPFGRRELAELIWLASHENIGELLSRVPAARQHRVRFEDLVQDPEGVLRGLCASLGLAYEPAMARPYEGRRERMTDGLHAESRMLGDVKFHGYRQVEPGTAERWREGLAEDFLGEPTWKMAATFGYSGEGEALSPAAAPAKAAAQIWLPLQPVSRAGVLPLSFAQERLWFLDRLEPGSAAYNISSGVRLRGALDPGSFARALSEVVRRHEALRTSFAESPGQPMQVVSPPAPLPLPRVDLGGLPAARQEPLLRSLAAAEERRPFDLTRGPLVRSTLVRLAAREHALL